jgi:hypothetical protein
MESINHEADRLIHEDRREVYGHCLDEYTRLAGMVSAAFAHKLKESFSAEDMLMFMVLLKASRVIHNPKRDSLVDLAGYTGCIADAMEERARRGR